MIQKSTGGCLCGGVAFEVNGKLRDVVNCHCKMCRVFHGDQIGYTTAAMDTFKFTSDKTLKWYHSSDIAKRGFCDTCGASMFFMNNEFPNKMGIAAGCLADPTGLTTTGHIFVGSAGDYYELHDDLPKLQEE